MEKEVRNWKKKNMKNTKNGKIRKKWHLSFTDACPLSSGDSAKLPETRNLLCESASNRASLVLTDSTVLLLWELKGCSIP